MVTGVTRPFHAPHALFTPPTGGTPTVHDPEDTPRRIRSMTRFCARDITDDIMSLLRRARRSVLDSTSVSHARGLTGLTLRRWVQCLRACLGLRLPSGVPTTYVLSAEFR